MTELSKECVDEFKNLFEKHYGVKYSDPEAREAASNLINFFALLLKIDNRHKKENKETDS